MKRIVTYVLTILLVLCLVGCVGQPVEIVRTVKGNMKTYHEMSDGTWQCNGNGYRYRLEITGRLSGATADSTYVYLSNIEDISFQKAAMASGLSSNLNEYFTPDEAVLVEMGTDVKQEEHKTALRMPELLVITGCYDGATTVIKPKGTDAILFQTGEEEAVAMTLNEAQIQYLNAAYEAITDFSGYSDQSSTMTVTIRIGQQTHSFGHGCAKDPLLNDYIDDLLTLESMV